MSVVGGVYGLNAFSQNTAFVRGTKPGTLNHYGEMLKHSSRANFTELNHTAQVMRSMSVAPVLPKVAKTKEINSNGYEYLDDQVGNLKSKVNIKKYESSDSVNEWWAEEKGYTSALYSDKTAVQNIELNENTTFVRIYDNNTSSLKGGWVMRKEDIQGLTPIEIQEKFALPTLPEFIGEVSIPKGSYLRIGETAPNFGFNGGGTQFDLKGQYIGDFKEIGKLVDWSVGN